jgi:hypothetical protein
MDPFFVLAFKLKMVCAPLGLQSRIPGRHELSFANWWRKAVKKL